jgi:hypothetical protein
MPMSSRGDVKTEGEQIKRSKSAGAEGEEPEKVSMRLTARGYRGVASAMVMRPD